MSGPVRFEPFDDAATLAAYAADAVRASARRAVARRGRFDLVLAGGATPLALYRELAAWRVAGPEWHLWFGDERCLPRGDPGRNDAMAADVWLDAARAAGANVHPIPAELGPRAGAAEYGRELADVGPFDLVLLGLGEDGHTASLFPGHDWGEGPDAPAALAVFDAPKAPAARVSQSAVRLSDARHVLFLVAGAAKREAVARWRAGEALPAAAIRPQEPVEVLVTRDACPDPE